MKVWGFFYNSCIHESAAGLQSLYKTKERAEQALQFHKTIKQTEYHKMVKQWIEDTKRDQPEQYEFWNEYYSKNSFGEHEDWFVKEIEILD